MNILVIRFSSLGDLVTLEPTFRMLKYFFKKDNITLLTSNVGKSLYVDTDYFNEYIIHKKLFNTIKFMYGKKYDIVINLQCNKPSHYISSVISKKQLVNKSYNLLQKILKTKVKVKSRDDILLNCSIPLSEILKFNELDDGLIKLPVDKSISILNNKTNKKIIAISTGTSERWESKKWFLSSYIGLIEKLLANNFDVILIGTSLEIKDSKEILNKFPNIKSFVGKTNLTQLKKLLSEIDLFVGNDSGPVHIAASVSTSTLTIFGSTNIKHGATFTPYAGNHKYIKPTSDIKCHPCYKTKCPTHMECMSSIKIEQVFDKIKNIINKGE